MSHNPQQPSPATLMPLGRGAIGVARAARAPEPRPGEVPFAVMTAGMGGAAGNLARGPLDGRLSEFLHGMLFELLRDRGLRPVACFAEELVARAGAGWGGALLCADSAGELLPTLCRLREHPDTALLPVLCCVAEPDLLGHGSSLIHRSWRGYADAVLEAGSSLAETAAALARIRRVAEALRLIAPAAPETPPIPRRRLLLLQVQLSRGLGRLVPTRDPEKRFGHAFAPLDLVGGPTLRADLEALAEAGLLSREFFDRIHVCPACGDARLAFREVCGRCHSADLRHGFDRAEQVPLVGCNACQTVAREGATQARCLACSAVHGADGMQQEFVFSYALTPEGVAAASAGKLPPAARG